jgi:hypothetical protein
LIANGSEEMASVFVGLFDLAMRIERERFLGVQHYEHTARHNWPGRPEGSETGVGSSTIRELELLLGTGNIR